MIDITAPNFGVEILVSHSPTGRVVHVNVDGVCALRVCRIPDDFPQHVACVENETRIWIGERRIWIGESELDI